jgi:hypothetical protein
MIKRPKLMFSAWHRWDTEMARGLPNKRLPFSDELEWPGIYVWAWFNESPNDRLSLLKPPREILYVGEAKRPLRERLNQFSQSYFSSVKGHDGGLRVSKMTKQKDGNLYLSYFSLRMDNEPPDFFTDIYHWSRAFLHYAERVVIWQYVRCWGRRPDANNT